MKFVLASILFCIPLLQADDASKAAKIDEIFTLTKMDRLQQQMADQLKSMIPSMTAQAGIPAEGKAQSDELTRKILSLVFEKMSWEKLKPTFAEVYAETFSEDEINGILAFYKTPSGQALLEKTPVIMSKSMTMAQAQMRDLMPQIEDLIKQAKQTQDHQKP